MDIRRSLVLEPPKSNAIPYPLQDLVLTGNDEGLSLKAFFESDDDDHDGRWLHSLVSRASILTTHQHHPYQHLDNTTMWGEAPSISKLQEALEDPSHAIGMRMRSSCAVITMQLQCDCNAIVFVLGMSSDCAVITQILHSDCNAKA